METSCFVCKKPVCSDIHIVKSKGVKTLLLASITRGDVENQRLLETVNEIRVHLKCYKRYADERASIVAGKRKYAINQHQQASAGMAEVPEVPAFDFKNRCLFCSEEIKEQSNRTPLDKRIRIHSVYKSSAQIRIKNSLGGRTDEFARELLQRINLVPDLATAGARYHRSCVYKMYKDPPQSEQKRRSNIDKIDDAMDCIYSFLLENSNEYQFKFTDLMSKIEGNFKPDVRTVKKHLQTKFGEDIFIIDQNDSDCIICLRNIVYTLREKKMNPEKEKERVLRETAAIIRTDITTSVYDNNSYPPSDDFLKNARKDVPASLHCLLSEIIMKDKQGSEEMWSEKCTSIAHAIITAVRPRPFLSSVQLGVGTLLYKKFGSKNLIDTLSAMGFCASYSDIINFERARKTRPESNCLPIASGKPISNAVKPAASETLKLISCKCQISCGNVCGCRKAGLKCSPMCLYCSGETCDNVAQIDITNDYDDNDIDDDDIETDGSGSDLDIEGLGPSKRRKY